MSLNGTSAHYLRIHPVGYNGASACMRIALYGCDSGKVKFDGICLFDCLLNVEFLILGYDQLNIGSCWGFSLDDVKTAVVNSRGVESTCVNIKVVFVAGLFEA